jgi:non-specific serine/threonine protein kinase
MTGRTLSHFRIEEKIASGGMGVLYKATDLKLDRNVAIKVLRSDLLSHPDIRQRFVREAKAASALNHPGIVTVHEIDTDSGIDFIAMEYVEGRTLDEMVTPEGMPIESVTGYALQMVEALRVAHEKGIVHRDLKPANVMITEDDGVTILDFGIAKRLYPAPGDGTEVVPQTQITQAGGVIGTLRYLSPEQASGSEVDHRTDIWSFGVMLYEMVTGQLPFLGEDNQEVIRAILSDAQASITSLRSDVPEMLERIIEKCLAKDRTDRYQTAGDLEADLSELRQAMATGAAEIQPATVKVAKGLLARRWPLVAGFAAIALIVTAVIVKDFTPFNQPTAPQRKMIVVLPFVNLGSPEDEYFADGITEELIARLASIRELGVIARTSAMQYKETDKTIHQIGEELGVEYVLEGTIRWQQTDGVSRVRVTPQLIRVSDEIHLWAEVFEKDLMDIFQVQSEIATRVAENLDITLLGPERKAIEAIPTDNPDAYQAYLRGLEYLQRVGSMATAYLDFEEDAQMAITMFDRAIRLDPSFALAYAALSRSHFAPYFWFKDHTEARLSLMKDSAERALELGPNLPESHLAMGTYHLALRDYDNALEEYSMASKLRPNDADVITAIAYVQRRQGEHEAAVENLEKAFELNPQNVGLLLEIGENYMGQGDPQRADAYYNRAISLAPDFPGGYVRKAWNYCHWNGDLEKARAVLEQTPGGSDLIMEYLIYFDWFERKYQSALDRLKSMKIDAFETPENIFPRTLLIAEIYLSMGQNELCRTYADSARLFLESELEERPDDRRIYHSLGFAYACLGRKEEAIRMGEMAVQSTTISQDPLIGSNALFFLAQIYFIVGEYDAAIDKLEYCHEIGHVSIPFLRIAPTFDLLRDHPRFQQLIAGEPKDSS